jgi:lysophospholipase L1-like esterase
VLLAAALLVGVVVAAVPASRAIEAHLPAPAAATKLTLAFYGDSFTWGAVATSPSKRWSTLLVGKHGGWREFNAGVRGLGFVANRTEHADQPKRVIAAKPDVVIVMMGLNDLRRWKHLDHGAVKRALRADIRSLVQKLPNAEVVVLAPMWNTAHPPKEVGVMSNWLKEASADFGADFVPGATAWLAGKSSYLGKDGLHPNDKGHAYVAKRVDEALTRLRIGRS